VGRMNTASSAEPGLRPVVRNHETLVAVSSPKWRARPVSRFLGIGLGQSTVKALLLWADTTASSAVLLEVAHFISPQMFIV
jgi:hypothetical protein